jgi:hypothetical protein
MCDLVHSTTVLSRSNSAKACPSKTARQLPILAFAPKAFGGTVMIPGETGAAGELNDESTSVGLKNATQKAKPLIIMWQHSDEEAPRWDGESGARCACGCGPLDGIASW